MSRLLEDRSDLQGLEIDRAAPLPVYAQMREQLLAVVRERRRAGISTFFTDDEIANHYGVSRMTARQALAELVRDGHLYRRKGVGTFIASQKVIEKEGPVGDFLSDWPTQGHVVTVEVPEFGEVPCPESVATVLRMPPFTPVLHFRRRRLSDGAPVALDWRWVAPPGSRLISREELEHQSIHLIVAPKLGIRIARAHVEIEAARCTREQADLLELDPDDPVLLRTVTPFSSANVPLWTGRSIYRADLYKYSAIVEAP